MLGFPCGDTLTVLGDVDSLGLVPGLAHQHHCGVQALQAVALLQAVVHRLGLPPARTQDHRQGLGTPLGVDELGG